MQRMNDTVLTSEPNFYESFDGKELETCQFNFAVMFFDDVCGHSVRRDMIKTIVRYPEEVRIARDEKKYLVSFITWRNGNAKNFGRWFSAPPSIL